MIHYHMIRGGETVADVVTLPNARCIVSWPTSTIVYDSEREARMVHVEHMAGRGEPTTLKPALMPEAVERGWTDAYQDRCEGIGGRLVGDDGEAVPPDYIPEADRRAWKQGYESCCMSLWGADWKRSAQEAAEAGEGGAS